MPARTDAHAWYVVQTRPGFELRAAASLELLQRLVTYVPEVIQTRRGHRGVAPFFPGYLFVTDGEGLVTPTEVARTPAVLRIVSFGGLPAPLPPDLVDTIRHEVDTLNARGGLAAHSFREGERVRFTDGPLYGLEGVFLGPMTATRRVEILLDFIGQRTVRVDVGILEAVAPHPPRRTRGKGRWIRT